MKGRDPAAPGIDGCMLPVFAVGARWGKDNPSVYLAYEPFDSLVEYQRYQQAFDFVLRHI